jgi:hypothetical protein
VYFDRSSPISITIFEKWIREPEPDKLHSEPDFSTKNASAPGDDGQKGGVQDDGDIEEARTGRTAVNSEEHTSNRHRKQV